MPAQDLSCDTSKAYHSGDSCFPLAQTEEASWSLREVFGRPIKGACSLAPEQAKTGLLQETVCISTPSERTVEVRSDVPTSSSSEDELRCYELPATAEWDVHLPAQKLETQPTLKPPRLTASRSINGYGQERGSVQATISNPSQTEDIQVVYLESLPWYMKPYLHTLRASLSPAPPHSFDAIQETYYRPALDRHRGTHLEVRLAIPPGTTLTLTYDFDKAILRYTEYPPDANRGFDVAAAVVRLLGKGEDIYVRTTTLLLPLPTPDFSMPYNVIILTSTVMALGFGSIFNLLVRRVVAADEVPAAGLAVAVGKFREKIRGNIARVVGKFGKPSEKKVQ